MQLLPWPSCHGCRDLLLAALRRGNPPAPPPPPKAAVNHLVEDHSNTLGTEESGAPSPPLSPHFGRKKKPQPPPRNPCTEGRRGLVAPPRRGGSRSSPLGNRRGPPLRWGCASGPASHRRPPPGTRGRASAPFEPAAAAPSPSGGKAARPGEPAGPRLAAQPCGGRRRLGGVRGWEAAGPPPGLRRRGGPRGPAGRGAGLRAGVWGGSSGRRERARAALPPGHVCRG